MTHNTFHTCNDAHIQAYAPTVTVQSRMVLAVATLTAWLKRAYAVHMQRRSLLTLSDRQLRDIGLERAEALREASRPFWDQP